MAESLGAAVLTVSVDDAQLKAGLQAAERQAASTGQSLEQAFTRAGRPLKTAANGLEFYIDAQGRARDASGKFLSVAQQQAAGLDRLGNSAEGAGDSFGKFGTNLGAFAAKAAAAVATLETIRRVSFFTFSQLAELDSASAAVRTLGVDSDDLTRRLRAVSVELGNSVSTVQLTAAAYDVASAGFANAADATQILRASALGASAGFAGVNEVASALTSVLNAYGLTAANASEIVDGFVQTQADGVITVRQYSESIGRIVSVAASAGVSIEELNAAIATATLSGVQVDQAVTGLGQALANIINPTKEAQELAAGLGIEFSASALNARGLSGVLDDVVRATGGSAEKLGQLFSSTEALRAIQPLLNDELAKYNELLLKQANASGTAAKGAETNFNTISSGLKQIGNGFSNLVTTLDTALTPLLSGFIKDLNSILVKLNQVAALAPDKVQARERQATEAVQSQLFPGQAALSGLFRGFDLSIEFNGKTYKGSAADVRNAILKDLLNEDLRSISGASATGPGAEPSSGTQGTRGETVATGLQAAVKNQEDAANRLADSFKKVEEASDGVAQAQAGLRSALEGGFDLLTKQQQDSLKQQARADLSQAVKAGFFDRDKVRNISEDQLLSAASQARAITDADQNLLNAQTNLSKTNQELATATNKLAEKEWKVNVNVDANTGASSVDLG